MRLRLSIWLSCLVTLLGTPACYEDIDIAGLCHPTEPACADEDFDGDGVANGLDAFPADAACAVRDDTHCSACGVGCAAFETCLGAGQCVCSDPTYTGATCEACADPTYTGATCEECADPRFAGATCEECADPAYTGVNCDECSDPALTGPLCDVCVEPDGWLETNCTHVPIAPGTFTMGTPESDPCWEDMPNHPEWEEHAHQVTLTRSFTLMRTEVTQGQWQALMGSDPSWFDGCDECPVEFVFWYEAVAYCNALSIKVGLPECYDLSTCQGTPGMPSMGERPVFHCGEVALTSADGTPYGCEGYRLPTEAEWEYAARAGTATATYNGDMGFQCWEPDVLNPIAWWNHNSDEEPRPVATKEANAWGLHDMLGNVWEWTWDGGEVYTGDEVDPVGVYSFTRVRRGGSTMSGASNCRAAARRSVDPTYRFRDIGFRVARTLP